jgi:hypothetical protein
MLYRPLRGVQSQSLSDLRNFSGVSRRSLVVDPASIARIVGNLMTQARSDDRIFFGFVDERPPRNSLRLRRWRLGPNTSVASLIH